MSVNPADFDNLRIALMNTYNAQVTNHIGYIIALVIGFATLYLTTNDGSILKRNKWLSYIIIPLFCSLIAYLAFRIVFWAWMGYEVLEVTATQAATISNPTVISQIQKYLITEFLSLSSKPTDLLHGISSIFYKIDTENSSFLSLGILFSITFVINGAFQASKAKRKLLTIRCFTSGCSARFEGWRKKLRK
jgi:hypothetical protein